MVGVKGPTASSGWTGQGEESHYRMNYLFVNNERVDRLILFSLGNFTPGIRLVESEIRTYWCVTKETLNSRM